MPLYLEPGGYVLVPLETNLHRGICGYATGGGRTVLEKIV